MVGALACLPENTIQELFGGARSPQLRAQAHLVQAPATSASVVAERFELVQQLGRGGTGTVYEALDRERSTRVALKALQHVSADGLLRFKTGFRAMQDIHHPNLVALGELFEDRGQWWLTMELVEGTGFLAHVRPGGQLDERRLRAALPQLSAALSALHAHGLIHRDVKPQNVVVTPAGRAVLLDFGLVAGVAEAESNVVGTPVYMAPEQARARDIGPAADWYGIGALLYEALTGTPPFRGAPLQVLLAKQHELPRRPRTLADVPDDLDALCMQLLAIAPDARRPAASALAGFDPAPASRPTASSPASVLVGRKRELAGLAAAFADARAGAGAIVLIEGAAGVGKRALVSHFLDDLHRREPAMRILAGRCYEREIVPYKAIDGVVDALARTLCKLPGADVAAVLPRRAGLLLETFPVLGKVAALRAVPAYGTIDRGELQSRALTALRELLERLAERGPLIVWIDELQWADPDSLDLLAWLVADAPLLLLLTSRPLRAIASSDTDAATTRLHALPALRRIALSPPPPDHALACEPRLDSPHTVTIAA